MNALVQPPHRSTYRIFLSLPKVPLSILQNFSPEATGVAILPSLQINFFCSRTSYKRIHTVCFLWHLIHPCCRMYQQFLSFSLLNRIPLYKCAMAYSFYLLMDNLDYLILGSVYLYKSLCDHAVFLGRYCCSIVFHPPSEIYDSSSCPGNY